MSNLDIKDGVIKGSIHDIHGYLKNIRINLSKYFRISINDDNKNGVFPKILFWYKRDDGWYGAREIKFSYRNEFEIINDWVDNYCRQNGKEYNYNKRLYSVLK